MNNPNFNLSNDSVLTVNGQQPFQSMPIDKGSFGIGGGSNQNTPNNSFGNGYAGQHQFNPFGNIYGQPGGQQPNFGLGGGGFNPFGGYSPFGGGFNPFGGGFNPFNWGEGGGFNPFGGNGGYNPYGGGYGGTQGSFNPFLGFGGNSAGMIPGYGQQNQNGFLGGAIGYAQMPTKQPGYGGINPGGGYYNNPLPRPMLDNFGQPFGYAAMGNGYDFSGFGNQQMPLLW